jgi:hypothetical protein
VTKLRYTLLDDLELAFADNSTASPQKMAVTVTSLGPLIQLTRSPYRSQILDRISISLNGFEEAAAFVTEPSGICVIPDHCMGLAVASQDGELALELMQRALPAINKSGFPIAAAAQVVSAIGELEANIVQHSRSADGGIVGFEVQAGFVGIYAWDAGVGILSSLRQNAKYAHLVDEGEAISLATQEGVSSSIEPGRGYGFRPVFSGLAAHGGFLRFKSGSALLEINGFGDGPPTQDIKERASTPGFQIGAHCTFK